MTLTPEAVSRLRAGVSNTLVADTLGRMHDIIEPEQERGGHPRSKAGWVRAVVAALQLAGYRVEPSLPKPPTRFTETGFLSDEQVRHWNAKNAGDGDLLRVEPPSGTPDHFAWFALLGSLEAEHDPTEASLEARERNREILRRQKPGA